MQSVLEQLGTSFLGFYRENVLDRCICRIKDCFIDMPYGFPVFENNGSRSDLCLGRRKYQDVNVQANFHDTSGCIDRGIEGIRQIKALPFESIASESLFEFEYSTDEGDFERGVEIWMRLLQPILRDHLDRSLVENVLREHKGTRTLSSQETSVYSFQHVQEELAGSNKAKYLPRDLLVPMLVGNSFTCY